MSDLVRNRRSKFRILLGVLFLLLVILTRCGSVIVHSEIVGNVIDHSTSQPIESAVVVVRWELQGFDPSPLDSFAIVEAMTDASGAFKIPGWGPKFNWRFIYASLRKDDPEIIIFKNGYLPYFQRNHRSAGSAWFYRRADKLDGQTFALAAFQDSAEAYVNACMDIESRIRWHLYRPGCGWKQIPNLIMELHKAGVDAAKAGADGRSLLIDRIPKNDCEEPRMYFKGRV